ncbi:hypothetical protein PM082_004535 [Marasmius tenuissimus]|nr:hypothetical protein PM082_004535 [Marasmius tenuissimus]
MGWITALFVLTTIYNTNITWIQMGQTLSVFNAIKTNDYIPFFKVLTDKRRTSEAAAQTKWILYPFACIILVTDSFVVLAIQTTAFQHQNRALFMMSQGIINVLVIITAIYASLLTLLTAGRIWWTVRQVGQVTGSRVYTKYKIIIATILESGFLFSATQVVGLVLSLFTDPGNSGLAPFDFSVINVQMAAITPTLIVVRIAYGQAVESVQQMVSTLQFAEGADISQHRSAAARATVDLRPSLAEVAERHTAGRNQMSDKPPLNVAGDTV